MKKEFDNFQRTTIKSPPRCAKSPDFAPQKTTKLCQSTITLHKTLTKYEKKIAFPQNTYNQIQIYFYTDDSSGI